MTQSETTSETTADQDAKAQARAHSKAYYERVKMDPAKLAARNARIAADMRARRARKRSESETTSETTVAGSVALGDSKAIEPGDREAISRLARAGRAAMLREGWVPPYVATEEFRALVLDNAKILTEVFGMPHGEAIETALEKFLADVDSLDAPPLANACN